MEYKNSGRKDTGRTDKYSDETPAKDYADYRKDYPNDNKEPRKIAKDITDGKIPPRFIGPKSFEVKQQELISHIQNYTETMPWSEKKIWIVKLAELQRAIGI